MPRSSLPSQRALSVCPTRLPLTVPSSLPLSLQDDPFGAFRYPTLILNSSSTQLLTCYTSCVLFSQRPRPPDAAWSCKPPTASSIGRPRPRPSSLPHPSRTSHTFDPSAIRDAPPIPLAPHALRSVNAPFKLGHASSFHPRLLFFLASPLVPARSFFSSWVSFFVYLPFPTRKAL